MKHYEHLSFDSFWAKAAKSDFFAPSDFVQFSDVIGFHIYADLRLNLDLAAAEDSKQAMKCVDLLEDFTTVTDRCAAVVGARILEVQGDRVHLLLPTQQAFQDLPRLLIFAAALTQTVYNEIKPKAGADWKGFSMAADHGPAILVPSTYGGGSVVSLGNAANQPAKKLGRGVDSGFLALPSQIGKHLPSAKPSGDWVLVDVVNRNSATVSFFDERLTEQMREAARKILGARTNQRGRDFARQIFEGISYSITPLKTRGMCLRADLDGFTKAVEDAFKNNKVGELVKQFGGVMQYPVEFAQKLGRPLVELPWAGDCCTALIQPRYLESVEEMRSILPVEAGRCWHGIAYEDLNRSNWKARMGTAKWAIGMACGDTKEGGDGNAIVAEFAASGRTFRVIVGWCGRRAKDAQETSGISGDDLALPVVDYQNLEEVLKPLFKPIGSNYRFANCRDLRNASKPTAGQLAAASPAKISGISNVLPTPRPYWR